MGGSKNPIKNITDGVKNIGKEICFYRDWEKRGKIRLYGEEKLMRRDL